MKIIIAIACAFVAYSTAQTVAPMADADVDALAPIAAPNATTPAVPAANATTPSVNATMPVANATMPMSMNSTMLATPSAATPEQTSAPDSAASASPSANTNAIMDQLTALEGMVSATAAPTIPKSFDFGAAQATALPTNINDILSAAPTQFGSLA